jgi:hypothetical protein
MGRPAAQDISGQWQGTQNYDIMELICTENNLDLPYLITSQIPGKQQSVQRALVGMAHMKLSALLVSPVPR